MPNYIYPEDQAKKTYKRLATKGYGDADFSSFNEIANSLVQSLNQIGVTLVSCSFKPKGKYYTVWTLEISTPGTCDIFKLLETIEYDFDMPVGELQFTRICTNNQKIILDATVSC